MDNKLKEILSELQTKLDEAMSYCESEDTTDDSTDNSDNQDSTDSSDDSGDEPMLNDSQRKAALIIKLKKRAA